MGGDDLASDDEFLFEEGIIETSNERGTAISSDDDNSVASGDVDVKRDVPSSKSKKRKAGNDQPSASSTKSKKEKQPTPSSKIMIQAGRGIALDSSDAQAMFIGTVYTHSVKLTAAGAGATGEEEEDTNNNGGEEEDKPIQPEKFLFQPHHFYAPPSTIDAITAQKHHSNLSMYLRQSGVLPSLKRLKNWKHNNSPMVIVLTLSARRSVELLQQLSFLKLPVAKLFAKHMSVGDQVDLLNGDGGGGKGKKSSRCFPIGVGTPGRLLTLLRHGREANGKPGALRLNHTELIVIDCHEDSKGFNVTTLKDTVPELMQFMKEGVVGELERRKDKIKVALF
jgi:hypothetical protein